MFTAFTYCSLILSCFLFGYVRSHKQRRGFQIRWLLCATIFLISLPFSWVNVALVPLFVGVGILVRIYMKRDDRPAKGAEAGNASRAERIEAISSRAEFLRAAAWWVREICPNESSKDSFKLFQEFRMAMAAFCVDQGYGDEFHLNVEAFTSIPIIFVGSIEKLKRVDLLNWQPTEPIRMVVSPRKVQVSVGGKIETIFQDPLPPLRF